MMAARNDKPRWEYKNLYFSQSEMEFLKKHAKALDTQEGKVAKAVFRLGRELLMQFPTDIQTQMIDAIVRGEPEIPIHTIHKNAIAEAIASAPQNLRAYLVEALRICGVLERFDFTPQELANLVEEGRR